jgi:serine/threonine protein kinase
MELSTGQIFQFCHPQSNFQTRFLPALDQSGIYDSDNVEITLPRYIVNTYSIGIKFESGSFGCVYYGADKLTDRSVIIKIIKVDETGTMCERARLFCRLPQHPNIMITPLIACLRTESNHRVLVLGYDQKSPVSTLRHYLDNVVSKGGTGLTEAEAKKIMRQILEACRHLMSHGFFHWNLSLDRPGR